MVHQNRPSIVRCQPSRLKGRSASALDPPELARFCLSISASGSAQHELRTFTHAPAVAPTCAARAARSGAPPTSDGPCAFSPPRLRCHPRQTERSEVQIGDLPLVARPKPDRSPLFVTLRFTAAGKTTMKVELAIRPLVLLKKSLWNGFGAFHGSPKPTVHCQMPAQPAQGTFRCASLLPLTRLNWRAFCLSISASGSAQHELRTFTHGPAVAPT